MKILIITFGSLGDVVPYIALGNGLVRAGHNVTVCTASRFRLFIEEHGLVYGYMTDELLKMFESHAGREAIEGMSGVIGSLRAMVRLMTKTHSANWKMMQDSWSVAKRFQPDLIFYHPKALAAVSIAEKIGIPSVMGCLQPMIVPTADFAVPGLPQLRIGRWGNRGSYSLVKLGYRSYRGLVNDFRHDVLGLPGQKSLSLIDVTSQFGSKAILHGFSSHVISRPADWPKEAKICGYWILDQKKTWSPPRELEDFLDAGDLPVYIGFGSMTGKNVKKRTEIVIEALQKANLRGILATGWGGLEIVRLPKSILHVESIPHRWLFPRMAAVVHHGGAGTTAAALLAGKPSLICPFMGDQSFWGNTVYELGAGPAPIPQKKMRVGTLVQSLNQLTENRQMHVVAEDIGKKLRYENGVEHTVSILEELI